MCGWPYFSANVALPATLPPIDMLTEASSNSRKEIQNPLKIINYSMRKLAILVLFAAMPQSFVLAKEGLLNSSYEEVAAILGKPSSHDNGSVSGIRYDRYHFETRGWKAAVLFIDGKAQKLDTEKSDGSPLSVEDKKAIFEAYDVPNTGQDSKLRGWRQLTENHFIRGDGRVHIITHITSMTIFWDDLPRELW